MSSSSDHVNRVLKGESQHGVDPSGVQVTPITAPRFDIATEQQQMLEFLDTHGFAVVKQVLNESDIEVAKSEMWDWIEALPPGSCKRDDIDTWEDRSWIPNHSNGIISGFGFGQSDFMWRIRNARKVKEAFTAIWGTEDLLVSFDGGNAFRPWQHNRDWLTDGGWYHVDQNSLREEQKVVSKQRTVAKPPPNHDCRSSSTLCGRVCGVCRA